LRRRAAAACVVACIVAAVASGLARRGAAEGARCGPGFTSVDARCVVAGGADGDACPGPLQRTPDGCDAPDLRVLVPAAVVALGPSDWEAEGRVTPRVIRVTAFRLDAFEATRGHYARIMATEGRTPGPSASPGDRLRAASGMTRADAERFCAARGGRLPTEDEWIVAAASAVNPPRRYPWGDTGAVCRRGAWGLAVGPCATEGRGAGPAAGPDTVGAHPDGDTPLGLHDLAGNVAEWVAAGAAGGGVAGGLAKGGSWASALATDLRIWATLEVDPEAHDPRVGVRCAYPP
jgi:formylglycine-generating enzyme required for sulfatase activity